MKYFLYTMHFSKHILGSQEAPRSRAHPGSCPFRATAAELSSFPACSPLRRHTPYPTPTPTNRPRN